HLHPTRDRAADELQRHRRRIGDAVRPARNGTEDVVVANSFGRLRIHNGHTERAVQPGPVLELGQRSLGRCQEQVADLLEERRPELLEEANARLGQPNLRLGRELLPNTAQRLRRRPARDRAAVAEHDVVRTELCQVVCDRRAGGTGAGSNDPSQRSSAWRSSSVSPRSGARTSSRTGTPRRPRTRFAAAGKGNCSMPFLSEPRSGPGRPRTAAATSLGKAVASPETAPAAPAPRPCEIRDSGPTKTSRPPRRYGSNRSHGRSETFSPAKFSTLPLGCRWAPPGNP